MVTVQLHPGHHGNHQVGEDQWNIATLLKPLTLAEDELGDELVKRPHQEMDEADGQGDQDWQSEDLKYKNCGILKYKFGKYIQPACLQTKLVKHQTEGNTIWQKTPNWR